MWSQTNAARTQEPAAPEPAERARAQRARVFGLAALFLGAFAWLTIGTPLPCVTYEARIEELELSVMFGVGVAIGIGCAVRSIRLGGWWLALAWLSLLANGSFLVLTVSRIVCWL
jgi:hypothetical protein